MKQALAILIGTLVAITAWVQAPTVSPLLNIMNWNVKSSDSGAVIISRHIAAFDSIDLLGVSEVNSEVNSEANDDNDDLPVSDEQMVDTDAGLFLPRLLKEPDAPTTPLAEFTPTMTPTATSTSTPTVTPTVIVTLPATPTATPTATDTDTGNATTTPSPTATATSMTTPLIGTATSTATVTPTATSTGTSTPTATATATATSTNTVTPTATTTACPIAPSDPNFNDPLEIPLDSTASVTDFVSYPDGDTEDRVNFSISGMNPNPSFPGGQARLLLTVSCFGTGTNQIQFFTGGQTYSCGQTILDSEVTADSDTGQVTITAVGGACTHVQWVVTGTATRIN